MSVRSVPVDSSLLTVPKEFDPQTILRLIRDYHIPAQAAGRRSLDEKRRDVTRFFENESNVIALFLPERYVARLLVVSRDLLGRVRDCVVTDGTGPRLEETLPETDEFDPEAEFAAVEA